jgi:formamidopyrimidine-DNA glycosylase
MPELPEVEAARRALTRAAVGRTIVRVQCAEDALVFEGTHAERVRRALAGRRVLAAGRHGKHLWLELDRRPWPCFHFGMTGGIHVRGRPRVVLRSSGRRDGRAEWPPRYLKLLLTLDDGTECAFCDARRLGRVRLRQDPATEPPVSLLGFDALRGVPPLGRLRAMLAARTAPVKAVLMDQSFSAGVGNWIADEVLYQAGIDPRRRAHTLTAADVGRLRTRLTAVVATAVRLGADGDRFPRTWLFHRRWSRRDSRAETTRGERIRYLTIGGRTTAWVAERQR